MPSIRNVHPIIMDVKYIVLLLHFSLLSSVTPTTESCSPTPATSKPVLTQRKLADTPTLPGRPSPNSPVGGRLLKWNPPGEAQWHNWRFSTGQRFALSLTPPSSATRKPISGRGESQFVSRQTEEYASLLDYRLQQRMHKSIFLVASVKVF